MDWKHSTEPVEGRNDEYTLIRDAEDPLLGILLLGFVFPFMWYYATILYFRSYYHRDPRERAGLAASAIAAMICTIAVIITIVVLIF
uniref:Uncharacterized protein n=1 Tax=Gossypium raimondii TaxID=29730 RepID=A0A0D2UJJ4_GOSRA|nr:hypothetical protein B456_011G063100 [Gossypium raimondii]